MTAWELAQQGISHQVIADNAAGLLFSRGEIDLVINTPVGRGTRADGWAIRTAAVQRSIPIITTTPGFNAAVQGIKVLRQGDLDVKSIQEWLA